jgi:hypothetical protein
MVSHTIGAGSAMLVGLLILLVALGRLWLLSPAETRARYLRYWRAVNPECKLKASAQATNLRPLLFALRCR